MLALLFLHSYDLNWNPPHWKAWKQDLQVFPICNENTPRQGTWGELKKGDLQNLLKQTWSKLPNFALGFKGTISQKIFEDWSSKTPAECRAGLVCSGLSEFCPVKAWITDSPFLCSKSSGTWRASQKNTRLSQPSQTLMFSKFWLPKPKFEYLKIFKIPKQHPPPQKKNQLSSGVPCKPSPDTLFFQPSGFQKLGFYCCGWNSYCAWREPTRLTEEWDWIMQRPLRRNGSHVLQAQQSASVLKSLCTSTAAN